MARYPFLNRGQSPYSWRTGPPASIYRGADARGMGDYVFRPGAPEVLTGDASIDVSLPTAAIGLVVAGWLVGRWLRKG